MKNPKIHKTRLGKDVRTENNNLKPPIDIFEHKEQSIIKMYHLMHLVWGLFALAVLFSFLLIKLGLNIYLIIPFSFIFSIFLFKIIKHIFYLMGYFIRVNSNKGEIKQ